MSYLLVCTVALVASGLTLFSGFGLGTLLLPAFALFFPIEVAVSATAIVHLANNVFKLLLVGLNANARTVLALGLPAVPAAVFGAWLLSLLSRLPDLASYELFGRVHAVTGVQLVIALLIGVFALLDLTALGDRLAFPPALLPLGGLAMGFFGGLSGHQGALRSAFLIRCGLSKEAFIGTGVVCAVIVDVTRVVVYNLKQLLVARGASGPSLELLPSTADGGSYLPLVLAATLAALAGAWIGKRLLGRVTLLFVRRLVGLLLLLLALGLGSGLL